MPPTHESKWTVQAPNQHGRTSNCIVLGTLSRFVQASCVEAVDTASENLSSGSLPRCPVGRPLATSCSELHTLESVQRLVHFPFLLGFFWLLLMIYYSEGVRLGACSLVKVRAEHVMLEGGKYDL